MDSKGKGFIPKDDEEDIILIEDEVPAKKEFVDKKETKKEFINVNKINKPAPATNNINEEKKEDAVAEENIAKNYIQGLLSYITNPDFDKKIIAQAQTNGLEPRQVADGFAMKILGTISDLLHLALDTISDAFTTLVSILAGILIKGGELLIRVFKRLVRIITLNKTVK